MAEKLETIEKEKENFDEWAKSVKEKIEHGDGIADNIKVGVSLSLSSACWVSLCISLIFSSFFIAEIP